MKGATSALRSMSSSLCKNTHKTLPPDEFSVLTCSKCFDNVYYMNVRQIPPLESVPELGNNLYDVTNHSLQYVPDAFANQSIICNNFLQDETLCQKWRDCCRAAQHCCDLQTNTTVIGGYEERCPITWDGLLCWDFAAPNTQTIQPCPSYYRLGETSDQLAIKECTGNGTWFTNELMLEWTDYGHCAYGYTGERNVLNSSAMLAIVLNSVSILLLAIGLILFARYRKISGNIHKILRIHALLFSSFIIFHAISLVWTVGFYKPMVDGHLELIETPWCKSAQGFLMYFRGATYWTLFCEVTYLLRRIRSRNTNDSFWMYLAIAFIPPTIPISVLIAMRISHADGHCWLLQVKGTVWYDYLMAATNLLALVVNLAGLCVIQYKVLTSYKATIGFMENGQRLLAMTKRLTYTAMAMLPVYGAQISFIVYRPEDWFQYDIIEAAVVGSQGAIIAIVYCGMNAEIRRKVAYDFRSLFQLEDNSYKRNSGGSRTSGLSTSLLSRRSNETRNSSQSQRTTVTTVTHRSDERKSVATAEIEMRAGSSPEVVGDLDSTRVDQTLLPTFDADAARRGTISFDSERE